MKKTIRLSESDLHKLIGESVKRILSEGNAWADQQPVDKNHSDWWYYRQEIEPDEVEDFGDGPIGESKLRNIVRESIKRVVNESYLYTKDINTDDLRINGHWTEDGYAEWEASVDNGWYTLRGTYDGHDCELDEIIEGHSGHSVQHSIDDDTIDWFNQNICDRVKSWLDKYAEDYSEWHSKTYGDE